MEMHILGSNRMSRRIMGKNMIGIRIMRISIKQKNDGNECNGNAYTGKEYNGNADHGREYHGNGRRIMGMSIK